GSPPARVNVASIPAGLRVLVDGVPNASAYYWPTGDVHALSAPLTNEVSGVRYAFLGWSDGGAATHAHAVTGNTTLVASYRATQCLWTGIVSPQGAGAITPAAGYFNTGTVVAVTATANAGWGFKNWTGALSGTSRVQSVTMSIPRTATANFSFTNDVIFV